MVTIFVIHIELARMHRHEAAFLAYLALVLLIACAVYAVAQAMALVTQRPIDRVTLCVGSLLALQSAAAQNTGAPDVPGLLLLVSL